MGRTHCAGHVILIFALVTGVVLIRWSPRRRSRRRLASTLRSLPDAIDILVAALRAGVTTIESISLMAHHAPVDVRHGFIACVRAHDDGARFHEALEEIPRLLGSGARPVVDLLRDHLRLGVPVTHTAEQLAIEARASRRRFAEARAKELPVRLALPLVLCTLPSFVTIVIAPVILGAFSHVGLG